MCNIIRSYLASKISEINGNYFSFSEKTSIKAK
nr:MAG TPA: hypothetical protein [Caudoviricetes sp.]